jgi:hypothetical protein
MCRADEKLLNTSEGWSIGEHELVNNSGTSNWTGYRDAEVTVMLAASLLNSRGSRESYIYLLRTGEPTNCDI